MKILGISCFYHDSAAALVIDGIVVAAAQEERFSRIKGDDRFPAQAIEFCLKFAKLSIDELDIVVFYEKPFLKFERILETHLQTAPIGLKAFLHAMPLWLNKKLNQKKLLRNSFKQSFKLAPKNILFSQHHLSHAASAFFPSPFEKAAVLCLDGVGEWATASAWLGEGNTLKPLWEIRFPHSLGLLYSTFTHYCGFKINSGEYKLMGLAPFGQPRFVSLIKEKLIQLNEDGSYCLNTVYFGFINDLVSTNKKFIQLFGRPPRSSEEPIDDFYKDVAASIQQVLNEAVHNLVLRLKRDTQADSLCLAGGVALNCVSNGLIAEKNIFKNIWIQPAAGDAGGSIGAALAVHYIRNQNSRSPDSLDSMHGSFLGPAYNENQIKIAVSALNLNFEQKTEEDLINDVSDLLASGKIVGWFQGRMEFGPRALGSRSILGNPLDANMKQTMNMKIKFREGFRPFAPIVTLEDYNQYFSLPMQNEYMLLVSQVKNKKLMPAITHVDDSARVQTVNKEKNKKLHDLLRNFAKKTGHPVLINTSFNVRGEPIVCSPDHALNCFFNTDIDALVMENFLIEKCNNRHIKTSGKWHEQFQLD